MSKLGQKSPKEDARFEILRISRWRHLPVFELDHEPLQWFMARPTKFGQDLEKNIWKRSSLMVGVNWGSNIKDHEL